MRLTFSEWRKQITYFKRTNFHNIRKVRGIVNTVSFFIVWGYAGYYIANKADKTVKETGIPHSIQVARIQGERYINQWNINTGQVERVGKKSSIDMR
jgi:hypothetical protein